MIEDKRIFLIPIHIILVATLVVFWFSLKPEFETETPQERSDRRFKECRDLGGVATFNFQMSFSGCEVDNSKVKQDTKGF